MKKFLFPFLTLLLVIDPFWGLAKVSAGEEDRPVSVPTAAQEPGMDVSFTTPPETPVELEQYRTAYSKRILKPDGTMTEEVYGVPIHYKDTKTNKWMPIDSTLEAENGKYKNKANGFSLSLPDTNDGQFDFSYEGTSISFIPTFSDPATGKVNKVQAKVNKNKMEFPEVLPGTDLTYDVEPNGLKESIILKSANVPLKYTYQLKTDNLTYKANSDGSIDFFKNGEEKALLKLEKPFLVDAKLASKDAKYVIRKDASGTTFIDVEVDSSWLKDNKRAFPVVLDPTVNIQNNSKVEDTVLVENEPNYTHGDWSHLYVGKGDDLGRTRSLFWFELPSLPSCARITDAKLFVSNSLIYSYNQTPLVEAHRVTSAWWGDATGWVNQPSIGQVDGVFQTSTTLEGWSLPITSLVQDWYLGIQPNYGVELKYADEYQILRELISNNNTSYAESSYPCLTINYTVDGVGSEPFWTFDGPVNMANRNLVLNSTDISFAGRNVPLSYNRTYNSRTYFSGKFGYGWNSVLDMKLNAPEVGPARLIEGDGSSHYFAMDSNYNYISPPGLYWDLYTTDTTANLYTTDGTQYTFDRATGHINEITDGSGNKIYFTYENGTLLRNIKDSANHLIVFSYNASGRVDTAWDPASRSWHYAYDSAGNLISVTTADDKVTQYRYDSSHNLTAIIQPKGNVTYFSYTSDDRISTINPVNAVTNGNFEVDSDGDGLPDHFTYSGGQVGKALIDHTDYKMNNSSLKIDASNQNSSNYTIYVSDPIQADTTKTYSLSGYLKGNQISGTQTTVLSLLAYDGSNNYLGEFGRTAETETFDWKLVTKNSIGLPAGTKTIYVKVGSSNPSGSGTSWFDGVQLEEGSTPSSFVCGSQYTANIPTLQAARYDGEGRKHLYTMNENQNITKYQQDPQGLNITESYSWDTTIPNTMTSYTNESGKTWKYSYDPKSGNVIKITDPQNKTQTFSWDSKSNLTSYIGVNTGAYNFTYDGNNNLTSRDPFYTSKAQEYDTNKNLTSETNLLGWAENIVKNSSFEQDGNGLPSFFSYDSGQQNTWSMNSTTKVYGNKSLKISASSSNTNNYTVLLSDFAPVDKTTEYVLSGYLKSEKTSGVQSTVLSVLAYNSSGTLLGEMGRINPTTTADWQKWSNLIRPSDFPPDTTQVRVKFGVSNSSGAGASYFDAIQLQKNPVETAYNLVDNSSFERGAAWPYFWSNFGNGHQWLTAKYYAGGSSVAIQNATDWSSFYYQSYIPYDPNKEYTLTAFVKTENLSAPVARIIIEGYDANYNRLFQLESKSLQGTNDWQRLSIEVKKNSVATGTQYIRPVMMSGNATGTAYFDNVRLQEGNVTTEYGYETTNTWVNKVTDPLGNISNFEFEATGTGNMTKKTGPDGKSTEYTYDNMDRVLTVKPPGNDLLVSYNYDANGNSQKVTLTNPGKTLTYGYTTYSYNGLDLLESVINPLNGTTRYAYTPSGLLQEITNSRNDKISFKYDNVNRNTDIDLNGVPQYHYEYDVRGNVLSSQDKILNLTWSTTYNDYDQITSWSDSSLGTINYTLDESGNVMKKELKDLSGSVLKTESFTYNKANQPTSLTDLRNNVSTFLFNENKMISRMNSGIDGGKSLVSSYSYDGNNRLTEVQNQTNSGQLLSSFKYGVNNQTSRIETITDQTGKTLDFTYNEKGQLLTEELPSGNIVTYSYNELGNRTSRVEKKPDGTVFTSTSYEYANNKFQISSVNGKAWSYENGGSGNVTCDGINDYTWDASNRITEIKDTVTKAVKATYKYDNQGRRIEQTVNGQVTKFLYDGKSNRVLAEYDGSGKLLKYYTWGGSNILLSITIPNADNSETTYYTVRNGHGDIVQLTDGSGNVVATYTYDAWGNVVGKTGSVADLNPYRYAGYRYDDTTGLYYLINRYYDASVGRFLSVDPVSEIPDYTYGANNPLSFVDPDGLWILDALWLVADVVSFVMDPTPANAAMIAMDLACFADPTGVASTAIHVGRMINAAVHIAKASKVVGKIVTKGSSIIKGVGGVFKASKREKLLNSVSNQKLKNCINEMYRPGAKIGDGGLADAIREELKTGNLVGGKSHIKKGQERLKNLENIINKQQLNSEDLSIAQKLYKDLNDALNGK